MSDSSGLRVEELTPREGSGRQYRLAVRVGGKREAHPLPEGETVLGRAERCDVAVEAAGVQGRHLCVKRTGDRLFARALGGAEVHGDEAGALGDDLRPLTVGQVLHFGAARVAVRRTEPTDRQAAVELSMGADVDPVPVRARLGDEKGRVHGEAERQLRRLTEALARAGGQHAGPEAILDAFYDCLAPPASALYMQDDEERWACLAVHGSAPPPSPSVAADGWEQYHVDTAMGHFALVVRLSEREQPGWQDALCRHVLRLAALLRGRGGSRSAGASREGASADAVWDEFVGSSVRTHLRQSTEPCRYARSVLVLGETGTGKELAVQALHGRLWQRDGPLVALNCAAVPEELLDAELFGVETGAATGVDARPGRFEQARGGTLFLDEVAEMPMALQSKLLRVLQERTYFRLGGTELLEADVHIVAASNRPEPTLRDGSHMRPDLYFRLAQATLTLPPLRDRTEDLPALSEHVLARLEERFGRGVRGLSLAALRQMKRYEWPGNVRELQNVLRTVYARTPPGELAMRRHLPPSLRSDDEPSVPEEEPTGDAEAPPASAPEPRSADAPLPDDASLQDVVRDTERRVIQRVLARQPRVADAAETLDLSTSYLYRKIKQLGIDPDEGAD